MEALWVGQRAHLRHLLHLHPDWTGQQLAEAVGCSRSMVYKWRRRFAATAPHDVSVLFSRSRAPHHHPPRIDEDVKERIQEIRLDPPEGLQRIPGPVAISYYLHRDQDLLAKGSRLPRSSRTIWRILDEAGLIERTPARKRAKQKPPAPLEEVQIDFKDVSTVPPDLHDPDAKRAHIIETCNAGGCGLFHRAGGAGACRLSCRNRLRGGRDLPAALWTAHHADLRPRSALGGQCERTRLSLCALPISLLRGCATQCLAPAPPRTQRLCGALPSHLQRRMSAGVSS